MLYMEKGNTTGVLGRTITIRGGRLERTTKAETEFHERVGGEIPVHIPLQWLYIRHSKKSWQCGGGYWTDI